MVDVISGLKQTSKGKLKYQADIDCSPGVKRRHVIERLTSPPQLSVEARKLIDSKEKPAHQASQLQQSASPLPQLLVSPSQPSPSQSSLPTSSTPVDDLPDGPGECSVMEQISQGIEKEESEISDLCRDLLSKLSLRSHCLKANSEHRRKEGREEYLTERAKRIRKKEQEMRHREAMEQQHKIKVEQEMVNLYEMNKLQKAMLLKTGEREKQEILEKIQEQKRQEELIQRQHKLRQDALNLSLQLKNLHQECHSPQLLPSAVSSEYKEVTDKLEGIHADTMVMELESAVHSGEQFLELFKCHVGLANEKAKELEQQKLLREAAEELKQKQQANAQIQHQQPQNIVTAVVTTSSPTATTCAPTSTSAAVPSSADKPSNPKYIEQYFELQKHLSKVVDTCASFKEDKTPDKKKYRFDLQKAVNHPVNAISAQSGEQLMSQIRRLQKLLSGQPVEVSGRRLSTRENAVAAPFCCNLLATKLVSQAETQVASFSDAAFPLAAVAAGVWSSFPEFGTLLLAHLYTFCPVLVPHYEPKSPNLTATEHLKLQGYRVSSDGVIETDEQFLKRMTGIVRFYAAIIQTSLPNAANPHGLKHGWAWLARVLNKDPHPSITATVLYDFLEIAGCALMKKYGKQFQKLLFALCKEYIHKIKQVTPTSEQGPLSRLTQFLERCIAEGRIPPPKGILTSEFWRSTHGLVSTDENF